MTSFTRKLIYSSCKKMWFKLLKQDDLLKMSILMSIYRLNL